MVELSSARLYGLSTLAGLVALSLVAAEAALLVPREKASGFLIALSLAAPFAVFLAAAVMPKRVGVDLGKRHAWRSPVVFINLGLPVVLCLLLLSLVYFGRDFDSVSGVTLFLAAVAGYDLNMWVRCLLLAREAAEIRGAKRDRPGPRP